MARLRSKNNTAVCIDRPALDTLKLNNMQIAVVGQTFRDEGTSRLGFQHADVSLMSEAVRAADELPAQQLDTLVSTTASWSHRSGRRPRRCWNGTWRSAT